jgi:hypothetical protein
VLALGTAAIVSVPAAHAAAPTPPYTALTVDGTGNDITFGADYLADASDGTLSTTITAPTQPLQFNQNISTPGASDVNLEVKVGTADSAAITTMDYPIGDAGTAHDATLSIRLAGGFCFANAGTLHVSEVTLDAGNVSAFAADYSGVTCGVGSSTQTPTLSGSIRWQSSQTYSAFAPGLRSWDWGNQLIKVDAQPVSLTFKNAGANSVGVGAASITGPTGVFKKKSDTCSNTTVAAGATCTITLVSHALKTTAPAVGALHLPASGLANRIVNLTVTGNDFASDYAFAGPQRVQLHWRQLPAPINSPVDHYRILRGSGPHTLGFLRGVPNSCCPMDVTDRNVTAGRVYYYSVQPVFFGGGLGMRTPVVAAKPWAKYSAGMYHRVVPSRAVTDHTVVAGRPYRLRLLGQYRIPVRGVSTVVLNVTVGKASRSTDVTVYPRGTSKPGVADVSTPAGATRSNMVIVKVGTLGSVLIANAHGSAAVTVDVSGYFSGAGLTTSGQGAALHEYTKGGTILDTKGWGLGPLPHEYYANAPVNFDPIDTPHVTSLLVQVTAFGSKAGGTITAYATNARFPGTSVLAYSAGATSTSTAIVSAGPWSDPSTGQQYPSASFLNRGPKPVQLKVSILGFFDDNTFLIGQRYQPTAPRRLLSSTINTGGTRTVAPGTYGHTWTTAFNVKVRTGSPTQTTAVSMWPRCCGVTAAAQPQLRAVAHDTTIDSTLEATGNSNRFTVRNASGRTAVSVWGFGTFEAWALPSWQWFVGEFANETAIAASTVENGLNDAARTSSRAPVVVDHLAGIGTWRVAQHAGHRYEFRAEGR